MAIWNLVQELGNRSIIFLLKIRIRLTRSISDLAEFMPFAPVLIEKNAKKLFKNLGSEDVNLVS